MTLDFVVVKQIHIAKLGKFYDRNPRIQGIRVQYEFRLSNNIVIFLLLRKSATAKFLVQNFIWMIISSSYRYTSEMK